jgi:DNA polymerase-3 subunit beta
LKKLVNELEDVEVQLSSNFAFLKGENWELITRLPEGEYPNYEDVIPTETPIVVQIERKELIKAIKKVTTLLEGKIKPVSLTLKENTLIVKVSDPEFGEAEDILEITYQGEPLNIEFNSRFLLEALNHFSSDVVSLRFIDSDSPLVLEPLDLKDEPYICLIMPMTI